MNIFIELSNRARELLLGGLDDFARCMRWRGARMDHREGQIGYDMERDTAQYSWFFHRVSSKHLTVQLLLQPLRYPWKREISKEEIYYYNEKDNYSTSTHPYALHFRRLFARLVVAGKD